MTPANASNAIVAVVGFYVEAVAELKRENERLTAEVAEHREAYSENIRLSAEVDRLKAAAQIAKLDTESVDELIAAAVEFVETTAVHGTSKQMTRLRKAVEPWME